MKNTKGCIITLQAMAILCLITILLPVSGGTPIRDADGRETGLFNANPDPNGEPWIYRPMEMTDEIRKELDRIPEWKPDKSRALPVPSAVDNTRQKEFRPIFNQLQGSCSSASGTGYDYTWEVNVLHNVDGSLKENQCHYYYTYTFLNGGGTGGTWYYDAWDISKKTGCVRVKDWPSPFGSEKVTEWANTYAAYHNANFDRCVNYYKILKPGTDGLPALKQWMYDHGKGDRLGGVVTFNANTSWTIQTVPQGSADAGSKIVTSGFNGTGTEHAMTFAGYNDDVYFNASSKGAVLLVNSWGDTWADSGKVWIPYSLFATETDVYCVEVGKYVPRFEYKVTLSNYSKSNNTLVSGYSSNTSATAPARTQDYGRAFKGNSGTFNGEIGLDCSSFYQDAVTAGGKGKFFLTTTGSGVIAALSLMVYDATGKNLVKEIKCAQTNVTMPATLSIIVDGDLTNIVKSSVQKSAQALAITRTQNSLRVFVPFNDAGILTAYDMQGRVLSSITIKGSKWYCMPGTKYQGMQIIRVKSALKTLVQKVSSL